MQQYLQNLLPRIKQYSKTLDHLENFIDKPWVHIDEDNGRVLYLFKRDQQLLLSINGKVTIGSWEYIKPANSILISRNNEQFLLNHGFISDGLMVLRQDGTQNHWVMINEQVIPDFDIENYLKNLNSSNENKGNDSMVPFDLKTDKGFFTLHSPYGDLFPGLKVSTSMPADTYQIIDNSQFKSITIKENRIVSLKYKNSFIDKLVYVAMVVLILAVIIGIIFEN